MRFIPACWSSVVAACGLSVIFGATPARAQSQPGFSPMVDFNGDARADIADHHLPSGQFSVRLNLGGGTFAAPGVNWGSGTTSAPSGTWQVLTADFNGDGLADYMDVHPASGQFWYHVNLGGGTFSSSFAHGTGLQIGPDWEVLAGHVPQRSCDGPARTQSRDR